jgi:outer membrane protein assembly factor BamA
MRGRLMLAVVALVAMPSAWLAAAAPGPQPAAAPAPPPEPTTPSQVPGDPPPEPLPTQGDASAPGEPTGEPAATGEPAPVGGETAPVTVEAAPLHEDQEFGPVIQIEQIDITGNTATQTEIIRRALPIRAGDVLHASDKRLRDARFKVLALGFFRSVSLAIHKGSERGRVIVEVRVVERGTLVLNRLWFGTTGFTPWWLGADVGERNLLGLGIAVGGGFVYAHHSNDIPGARDQYAAELRVADPSVRGSAWGASWATTLVHGDEPYRVAGGSSDTSPGTHRTFPYRRLGVRLGATYNLSATAWLTMGARAESIDTTLPVAPTRALPLPDGRTVAVDLHLDPGTSHVVTASLGFERDTRLDPILPHAGGHLVLSGELGSSLLGSSYDFATIFGAYEHYWPLSRGRQAFAIKLAGGVVVGEAPRFDRIYIADVDRMLTPRALGLVLSTSPAVSILGTRADKPSYGDLGGIASAEYAFQLFRGRDNQRIYGGDVFIGAGLWGLAERADLQARDSSLGAALPIDVYLDAGIRLDTDIGTFELTIANALGRLR